jgi:hypothetical protein
MVMDFYQVAAEEIAQRRWNEVERGHDAPDSEKKLGHWIPADDPEQAGHDITVLLTILSETHPDWKLSPRWRDA